MTVWILHLPLTPEQETRIRERVELPLPFDGLPDLSRLSNQGECRKLLLSMHPDESPESLAFKSDRLWKLYGGLEPEDIIAVPLKARREVALAHLAGRYRFEAGVHLVPVTWYENVALRRFGKHQAVFDQRGEPMIALTDRDARIAIQDKLPHGYNRFAKWKWLMLVFLGLSALRLLHQVFTGQ